MAKSEKLTPSQQAVFLDIKRMSKKHGWVHAARCQHLDGRTLRSLETRGLILYRDFRYWVSNA